MTETPDVALFSYGTLQLEDVQLTSFGRRLEGAPDAMVGYRKDRLEITDPQVLALSAERFHPIVVPTADPADVVEGMVFLITPAELEAADRYEVGDYKRIRVRLRSAREAWVYVRA